MKVVWAYLDWSNDRQSDLHKYPYQASLSKYSLLSWIRFAPQYTRCLYANQTILELLESVGTLPLFQEIHEITDRDIRKHGTFFALPKIYAYAQQTEPFWICDLDMLLLKPLPEDLSKYWCFQNYDYFQTLKQEGNWRKVATLDSLLEYHRQRGVIAKLLGGTRVKWSAAHSVNGGLIFFPDPSQTALLSSYALKVNKALSEVRGENEALSWNLYEESLIRNIIRNSFNTDTVELPKDSAIEHTDNLTDIPQQYKSSIDGKKCIL